MANISNSTLQDWANEHDADFASKVEDLKIWRRLYSIASLFDLETVDDEGISHGTARDDLPCNAFMVAHELVEGVLNGNILSKADINHHLQFVPIVKF